MPSNYVDIIHNNSINMHLRSVNPATSKISHMSTLIIPSKYVDINYCTSLTMLLNVTPHILHMSTLKTLSDSVDIKTLRFY